MSTPQPIHHRLDLTATTTTTTTAAAATTTTSYQGTMKFLKLMFKSLKCFFLINPAIDKNENSEYFYFFYLFSFLFGRVSS